MVIGVLKEPDFETRVSLLAETVALLIKQNISVYIETSAGDKAFCSNQDYEHAGAYIKTRSEILSAADILLTIHVLTEQEMSGLAAKILIGVYQPLYHVDLMQMYARQGITVFSLDMLPRTSRAQSMDVLSSQANIAGYKAVLAAAQLYSRYFPMFMTAAGSIAPAKVLILGAGVAGLQAVATAKRLGAVVSVFDTRSAVKEEVQSLGAKFVEVEGASDASTAGGYAIEQTDAYKQQQQQKIAETIAKSDIVITTAQIPGKIAPILVSEEMVLSMRKGSVIVDLAASTGGNTPFTQNNQTVIHRGITIVGNSNLQSTMPSDASKLYGKNLYHFLQLIIKDAVLQLNWEDELVKGTCITHGGEVVHARLKQAGAAT